MSGCASRAADPAPAIPAIDWTIPEAPEYLGVQWSHDYGTHCLDIENAKALVINDERKNAYIDKLILQLTAMKNTFDMLAAATGGAEP